MSKEKKWHAEAKALDRQLKPREPASVTEAKRRAAAKITDAMRSPNHRGRGK